MMTNQKLKVTHKYIYFFGWLATKSFFALSMILVLSCSSQKHQKLTAEAELESIKHSQKKVAVTEAPAEVSNTLLASTANPAIGKSFNEKFDVSVKNVAAKDFFLGLMKGTGINLVVHPDVSGSVTLDLKNVSIDDVLKVTRDIYGYEYRAGNGIYTVYPNALRTEVFHINYLDVQRVGVSDTAVLVGRAQQSGQGNSGGGSSNGGSAGDTANLLGMIESAQRTQSAGGNSASGITPGSRVQTLNHTDFWSGLQKTLITIIGGESESRSVTVSPQAGMVVVKALPSQLSAVREYLERSELSVKRQVILEAKILEVKLNKGFEAGVNWNSITGQMAAGKNIQDGFTLKDATAGTANEFRSISRNLVSQNQTDGSYTNLSIPSREAIGGTVAGLVQIQDITKLVSLLETQGNVQVLSSPRVSTVNNQKAVIRVGADEYFVTGISNNTTSNATSVSSTPNIELSPFFSGIALDVTPQISENGEVVLHIHPVVSDVTDQQKQFTVGDKSFSLPLALRGIRESDSIVKAANGQVVVLGGLMQDSQSTQNGKRPLLGDIPLVNSLFRTKAKSQSKTELVILLRPIVVDENTWSTEIEQSQQRMKAMGDAYRNQ